jgi:predicted dehydrogenase
MAFNPGQEIRVGVCGAGEIVGTHLTALERVAGMRAVAVSSRTLKSARRMARRFAIRDTFDDHQRVIDHDEVDLVLVAVPNYQHVPVSLAALEAGKPVLLEKPLAVSVDEGRRLLAAAKRAGVGLFYAEQLPLAPKSVAAAAAAQAGRFGDIHLVKQFEGHDGPYSPWFFQQATAGGGVLMDLGCHSISAILAIVPDLKIERVAAITRTYRHTHGDVEDYSLVQMHFAGGSLGLAENSWCHHGGFDSITEIHGSKGSARVDIGKGGGLDVFLDEKFLGRDKEEGGWNKPLYDPLWENGYIAQLEAVRETLWNGVPAPQTGEDGLRVLRIMTAAYKSAAQEGRPQKVSL